MSGTQRVKDEVKELLGRPLAAGQLDRALTRLAALPAKAVVRALLLGLSAAEPAQRWRAVRLLGLVTAGMARRDPEAGREVLRRLRWGLNEESGAIGWGAAEAMGEICALSPTLAEEFAHLLFSYLTPCANFLEHPALRRGAIWALGRLALARPELARACQGPELLLPFLGSPDPEARGLAAWALGLMACPQATAALRGLLADPAPLLMPRDGELFPTSVGQLASQALAALGPA